jgi:hypothetical protein
LKANLDDRDAEALCRGPKIEKWWPINKVTDIKANEPSRNAIIGGFNRQLWVKNGYGGRSTGTSIVPQVADDFGAPRKSATV